MYKEAVSAASLYRRDLKKESSFSAFLDKALYRPLEATLSTPELPIRFDRITDLSLQHRGVDIILNEGPYRTYIDEKSQLHNVNAHIPTFAFELSYLKGDSAPEAGWLLSTKKITQAYALCWPTGTLEEDGAVFTGAKYLLVAKSKLLATLEAYGYDRKELDARDHEIRKNGKHGRYLTVCPDFHFFFSQQYSEQPINLVIKASFLEKLSFANLDVVYNKENDSSHVYGTWVGHQLEIIPAAA